MKRVIKTETISYFKNSKKEIFEYSYDYYTIKTVEDISRIIEKDVDRVVAYLERIKHIFKQDEITALSDYGDVPLKLE